jgi:hypothetical protein
VKPHEVAAGGGMPGAVPLRGRHGAKNETVSKERVADLAVSKRL